MAVGVDLRFPHHENEIAQSTAVGQRFAVTWMHNAWVTTSGEKMSKSLGNSLLVDEVVRRVRPVELRYYLGSAHYRSHIEYSEDALAEAATAYRRIEGFLDRGSEVLGGPVDGDLVLPEPFAAAMDDDLSVAAALAVVHDTVRDGNRALADADPTPYGGRWAASGACSASSGSTPPTRLGVRRRTGAAEDLDVGHLVGGQRAARGDCARRGMTCRRLAGRATTGPR